MSDTQKNTGSVKKKTVRKKATTKKSVQKKVAVKKKVATKKVQKKAAAKPQPKKQSLEPQTVSTSNIKQRLEDMGVMASGSMSNSRKDNQSTDFGFKAKSLLAVAIVVVGFMFLRSMAHDSDPDSSAADSIAVAEESTAPAATELDSFTTSAVTDADTQVGDKSEGMMDWLKWHAGIKSEEEAASTDSTNTVDTTSSNDSDGATTTTTTDTVTTAPAQTGGNRHPMQQPNQRPPFGQYNREQPESATAYVNGRSNISERMAPPMRQRQTPPPWVEEMRQQHSATNADAKSPDVTASTEEEVATEGEEDTGGIMGWLKKRTEDDSASAETGSEETATSDNAAPSAEVAAAPSLEGRDNQPMRRQRPIPPPWVQAMRQRHRSTTEEAGAAASGDPQSQSTVGAQQESARDGMAASPWQPRQAPPPNYSGGYQRYAPPMPQSNRGGYYDQQGRMNQYPGPQYRAAAPQYNGRYPYPIPYGQYQGQPAPAR